MGCLGYLKLFCLPVWYTTCNFLTEFTGLLIQDYFLSVFCFNSSPFYQEVLTHSHTDTCILTYMLIL